MEPECEKSSATTYFWYRQTLNITSSIDDTGGLNWRMTLSLLGAWIIVCMAVVKGIQSSGKVRGLPPHQRRGGSHRGITATSFIFILIFSFFFARYGVYNLNINFHGRIWGKGFYFLLNLIGQRL